MNETKGNKAVKPKKLTKETMAKVSGGNCTLDDVGRCTDEDNIPGGGPIRTKDGYE